MTYLKYTWRCCLILGLFIFMHSCSDDDEDNPNVELIFDCEEIEADYGDSCQLANGLAGIINEECICEVDTSQAYDCIEQQLNIGDQCQIDTIAGYINLDCECDPYYVPWDCVNYQADVGDSCTIGNGLSGIIDEDCICDVDSNMVYDCPELMANVEDDCITPSGLEGYVTQNCSCEPYNTSDYCPQLNLYVGDTCVVNNLPGVVNDNCECDTGNPGEYDCPELMANIEDDCITPSGLEGYITQNCICQPYNTNEYCPELNLYVGDSCFVNNLPGVVNDNCECDTDNTGGYDCPELMANWWDACTTTDGHPGYITPNCFCQVYEGYCEDINLFIGDSCFVNNQLGFVNDDCICDTGNTLEYDCPELFLNFGNACITQDSIHGFINLECDCIAYDCPDLNGNIGDPCQNPSGPGTINENCECE